MEILERVNYAVGLLEAQRDDMLDHISRASGFPLQVPAPLDTYPAQVQPTPRSLPNTEDLSMNNSAQGDAEILIESLEIAGRNPQVSEDILKWSVFNGKYDRTKIEALIFNPEAAQPSRPAASNMIHLQEEEVPHLITKFLTNVHIKNPVLDVEDLRRKARGISENGFGWDGTSCLIVSHEALSELMRAFTDVRDASRLCISISVFDVHSRARGARSCFGTDET